MAEHAPRDLGDWMRSIERRVSVAQRAAGTLANSYQELLEQDLRKDSARRPAAPVEITHQVALYTEAGLSRQYGRVTVDFPDVTRATDGTEIPVMQYELWGRDDSTNFLEATTSAVAGIAAPGLTFPGLAATPAQKQRALDALAPMRLLSTSPVSSLRISGLIPGSVWTFMVRAIGQYTTEPGEWSQEFQTQLDEDTTPPPQPTAPEIISARGTLTVKWDGLSVAGAMPGDFEHLVVAAGSSSSPMTPVAVFYRGGGTHVLSGFDYYTPQFVRFQAVDLSGNRSLWSAQAVGYTAPLVDTDVILSEIDAAKTHLINVDAGVSILKDTIITEHLVITEEMTAALAQFLHVKAGMIEANAVQADSIAAGAVTASKLEAVLALVSKIIAGPADGTHAEMDSTGFKVYAADPTDGVPNEVVRMGVAASDDYLAITKGNGELAATITAGGVGSFIEVNARDAMTYRGEELTTILDRLPKGIVATAHRTSGGLSPSSAGGSGVPFLRMDVMMKKGRHYRISTTNIRGLMAPGSRITVGLSYRFDAIADMTNKTTLSHAMINDDTGSVVLGDTWTYNEGPAERMVSWILWWAHTGTSSAWISGYADARVSLLVEDVGAFTNAIGGGIGTDLNSGVAAPPAKTIRTVTFNCFDSASYTGSNAWYNYDNARMYQGLSPAGYGNMKSIAVFPDMTATLSGASINYIRVYFNFNHWYNNAGGTARIGLHGLSGVPGSFSGNLGIVLESGGWPKPGARWLDIPPQHWDNFKSGAYRGVYLEGDGTYNTYGIADRPVFEISYTK